MNARDKIPQQALELAQKILRRSAAEQGRRSPMEVFTEELELALLDAFDVGQRMAKRQAQVRRRGHERN